MKVFFINTVCGVGSTGTIVTDLMALLRQRRDQVMAAYGFGEARHVQPGEAVKMTTPAGYYLHNALSRLTDKTGLYSARETEKLIRRIEAFDPDVIHLHNLHGYYLNYEILFRYLAASGKKVVWTLHDCWAFTGHCTHFLTAGCDQWKTGCAQCAQLREYPVCYLRGNVLDNYARKKAAFTSVTGMTVATPSDWLRQQAKQSFLKNFVIRNLPNGIDTGIFCPGASNFREKHGLRGRKILLGVAGTWSQRKGLQDFAKLAKMVPENHQIVLVGVSETQVRDLPEGIMALPRTGDPRELAEIYRAADVFVNPTYEDTYPTVNLEAQACGTPVVTYDVGGCAQTVAGGQGVCVPCGDLDALQEAIQACLEAPPETDLDALRRRLDKGSCYGEYLKLYDSLVK